MDWIALELILLDMSSLVTVALLLGLQLNQPPHSSCSRIPEDLLYLAALDILDHANKLRTWDMRYYLPMSPKLMPCRISSSWNPAHMAVCGE